MTKIIFLTPFSPDIISGGIKVTYQHAAILADNGYEVEVYQPAGKPTWMDIPANVRVCDNFEAGKEDILVFPEVLKEFILEMAEMPFDGTKVLFCQNPFYLYSYNKSGEKLLDMGFEHFIVTGREAARSVSSILGVPRVYSVPNSVDTTLFHPRQKHLCIATNPGKWPAEGVNSPIYFVIMSMLHLKYPETADVPWQLLEKMPQSEIAEIMGHSAIFLALSRQEALPLTPLEAMASRCALVGFHGTGGKDYASHRNGYWFSPEQCEEIVDCLAQLISGFRSNAPQPYIEKMLDEAEKTAGQYSVAAIRESVLRVYREILDSHNMRVQAG
ncbi:glycosyltransferase family 4 protein [Asaia sp. As-1742]|uniref:glycosyltransferase family 4 protein n=1 Tax=Asaia sp. As-1742 TaxID=2608325 RepID=UPI0014232D04|nr:glycosyltransferase family 4 protein [Asaia sp. As-1742]NIE78653.1 glycosyltransferase family 4 protein [Asaia sp. As-1742]